MLPQKITTKREKRKKNRKNLGIIFVVLGLFFITASLLFAKLFIKEPLFVSPLSFNQDSTYSKLEKELKLSKIDYESLKTNDELTYTLKLKGNGEVILNPKKSILVQLSSLQLILAQLKIEGKTFRRLDFRFEKPVITF